MRSQKEKKTTKKKAAKKKVTKKKATKKTTKKKATKKRKNRWKGPSRACAFQGCKHKGRRPLNIGGFLVPQYYYCKHCKCVLRVDEPCPEEHLERKATPQEIRDFEK
jgi:hypothetical protein